MMVMHHAVMMVVIMPVMTGICRAGEDGRRNDGGDDGGDLHWSVSCTPEGERVHGYGDNPPQASGNDS